MYDIVIIGGGPGGYVAAIRAGQLGAKVALVEKDSLGGVCLNWGCIPTKSLLESADLYHKMQNCEKMGIKCSQITPDIGAMVDRSRKIVKQLTSGVEHLMKKNNVEVIKGHGRLIRSGKYKVVSIDNSRQITGANDNSRQITGANVIIATGASNRGLPGVIIDGIHILDCRHAMTMQNIPDSIVIVGGGVIGMEFASFFNALGSKVTVVEYGQNILGFADKDIIKWSTNAFKQKGIQFHFGVKVDQVLQENGSVRVVSNQLAENIVADKCLVAVGVVPNSADLGLEKIPSISIKNGYIETGLGNETGEPGIFAIGDVTSGPWLAHKAMQEGIRCVEGIMSGAKTSLDPNSVPMCVYSMPQIAQIGLTQDEAEKLGKEISVSTYPLKANGKALAEENDGFVKVIFEKNTRIFLGAHLVGNHVTELIHGYALLQSLEGLADDVVRTIFPHPTLSEAAQEAVMSAIGMGLHM